METINFRQFIAIFIASSLIVYLSVFPLPGYLRKADASGAYLLISIIGFLCLVLFYLIYEKYFREKFRNFQVQKKSQRPAESGKKE
jgi:hypothetical protein